MDPDKVLAIWDWPLPNSIKALRGFLGLISYYRRFVAKNASLVAPLTQLLRKNAFLWTCDATAAFLALKDALLHTLVLALLDFSKPFVLKIDASGSKIGVVLVQSTHPIAFFSKESLQEF